MYVIECCHRDGLIGMGRLMLLSMGPTLGCLTRTLLKVASTSTRYVCFQSLTTHSNSRRLHISFVMIDMNSSNVNRTSYHKLKCDFFIFCFALLQLNSVVEGIKEKMGSKREPLILLHHRRTRGGPANSSLAITALSRWQETHSIYTTPTGSNDDWYEQERLVVLYFL
jgi:hypothetical protein